MSRRTGLGRHSTIKGVTDDPLDGLVNLFDIGIVLAVAFLIAGLGLTLERSTRRLQQRTPSTQQTHTLPSTVGAPPAGGRGQPVGTVYQLASGQLVYVRKPR